MKEDIIKMYSIKLFSTRWSVHYNWHRLYSRFVGDLYSLIICMYNGLLHSLLDLKGMECVFYGVVDCLGTVYNDKVI
jgi:hypothetical protein